ncbi:MAG: hypothetical protein GEV13_18035 [Rhodospirillales bacterium]|nr:hypothetical protein [Rhodospirillales bacterium]
MTRCAIDLIIKAATPDRPASRQGSDRAQKPSPVPAKEPLPGSRPGLKDYEGVTDFDTDEWRRTANDFHSDPRETWERLVEEVLLDKVVERFNSDVRTQSLKNVAVENDDYKTVFCALRRVSGRSAHDMAGGRSIPTPTVADMKADFAEIDKYRADTEKRRKKTAAEREALEAPPAANVA